MNPLAANSSLKWNRSMWISEATRVRMTKARMVSTATRLCAQTGSRKDRTTRTKPAAYPAPRKPAVRGGWMVQAKKSSVRSPRMYSAPTARAVSTLKAMSSTCMPRDTRRMRIDRTGRDCAVSTRAPARRPPCGLIGRTHAPPGRGRCHRVMRFLQSSGPPGLPTRRLVRQSGSGEVLRADLPRLHQHQPVAGDVPHHGLHAVRAIGGLLEELHPLGRQLFVGPAAVVDVQTQPALATPLELAPDEVGCLVVQGWAGGHQGDLQLRLAGVSDGHPAEPLPHGNVGARGEAEDLDVEVARLVLVEAVDGDERDVGDHASTVGPGACRASLGMRDRRPQEPRLLRRR